MRNVNVIVIDSGIDKSHMLFKNHCIEGITLRLNPDGEIIISEDIKDEIGHGTAVCGILVRYGININIRVISIYDNELTTDETLLLCALDYIYESEVNCDIINMSLGLFTPSNELNELCNKLYEKGIYIVSAFDNTGSVSYPAAYDKVIGVDASTRCVHPEDFILVENGLVNIYAKGGSNRLAWLNNTYIISPGSSFSAAYVSLFIAKCIEDGKLNNGETNILYSLFKENAIDVYQYPSVLSENNFTLSFKIGKAAVFPYNKEIHSIVNFNDLLLFDIESIYDIRQHGYIGKKIKSLDGNSEYTICNYKDIPWESIDSIIIGHVNELSIFSKIDFKKELLDKCLEHKVNAYCFDDYLMDKYVDEFIKVGISIFYPSIGKNFKVKSKAGKLYGIQSPIIGIFGTSSVQGKHTLQLQLRRRLLNLGYNVGQLGSEPTALLFGMDQMFPFGYASNIDFNAYNFIELMNYLVHKIDIKSPDIILVGCQSATIPKICYNIDHLNIPQLSFLIGINPDIVILCVNVYDDISYIKRCILSIENLIECKIPVIAISPFYFENDWQIMNNQKKIAPEQLINEFKENISKEFGLKSYVIGTMEDEKIFDTCINYLSGEQYD